MDCFEDLRLRVALTQPGGEIRLTLRIAAFEPVHGLVPGVRSPTHPAMPFQQIHVSAVLRPGRDLLQRIAEDSIT